MRFALAQINTTVGDFSGNAEKIRAAYERGAEQGAAAVIFPELALCGYPPRDLLLNRDFLRQNEETLAWLAGQTGKVGMIVGYAGANELGRGRPCSNRVALLQQGRVVASRVKTLLPTYDVFEEDRYFEPAEENIPVELNGVRIGLTICEDVWNDEDIWQSRRYMRNPPLELVRAGAEILINVSASPWHVGKDRMREAMLGRLAKKTGCPVVYCNLVGGNDELIFDGNSAGIDRRGEVLARGVGFGEDLVVTESDGGCGEVVTPKDEEASLHDALVLGLRDYLTKCGFRAAILGLSGGIDSSLTAALAAQALGADQVRGVALPSPYSSKGSLEDAERLARNLGIRYDVVRIDSPFRAVLQELEGVFAGYREDTTEENIQARLRGVMLMAMSNKFGALLLTTGNKSELAVGYCTLYGDMSGGLAVISDVPKTRVYRLARWLNQSGEIIPESCLTKPPSAELRPDQKDEDSLPAYEVLDGILEAYVVEERSVGEIIKLGYDAETVRRIVRMVDLNEYKRRQAPPGLKVTSKAFGLGRRFPVAQRYQPLG